MIAEAVIYELSIWYERKIPGINAASNLMKGIFLINWIAIYYELISLNLWHKNEKVKSIFENQKIFLIYSVNSIYSKC